MYRIMECDAVIITSDDEIQNFDDQNSNLINKFLSTPQGRQKLAASMIQPLRTRIDYQGLARKMFVVDPLPQGAIPIYGKIK